MTLDRIRRGERFRVTSMPDGVIRAQAIRLGISEGEILTCEDIIPAGPIIIRKKRQQIALGRNLCKRINVSMDVECAN